MKLKNASTTPPKGTNKETTKKKLQKLRVELAELQNLMFATSGNSLLVIIQGLDASGKDGAIKNVFNCVNPMGCSVVSFKKPTEEEANHDFLWRIHRHTPARGTIQIFNRSHYEDVLVQRVHKWVSKDVIESRYKNINNFEQLLQDGGVKIIKFYMHVSKEKQMERLQERMTDETKKWKYNENDIKESGLWNDYREAYEDAFEKCNSPEWNIIPTDKNWYKEYLIAKKVVETLREMKMHW